MARTVTPDFALRGGRPGFGRSLLAVAVAALVLVASWALLIGGVVLLVRVLS
ncbi:MAG: hypothetical protein JO291_04515 [Acidimicrobiia bacterium]|nr:hypothetical protein [Acidimicrobiia bacterium]